MRRPPFRRRFGLAALLFLAAPLAAEPRHLVRTAVQWTQPSDDEGFDGATLEVEYAVGAGYAWEYLVTPQIGVELGWSSASHDVLRMSSGPNRDVGGLRISPATLMVNLHSQPGVRANLYVGAGVAYTSFGELELRAPLGPTRLLAVEDDLRLAAQLAMELPIARRWAVNLGARYFEAKAKSGELTLPVKPWVGWVGVRCAF
jgi:outer membrane protein W